MIRDQHAVPGQSIYYQLDGLEDVDYDIWISYPATVCSSLWTLSNI